MAAAAWQSVHPSVTGAIVSVVATPGHDLDGAHTFDELLDDGARRRWSTSRATPSPC